MNLFIKPISIHYNCRLLSEATIFYLIVTIIRFLLPLIILCNIDTLWLKESTFREMPDIEFKKHFILLLKVNENIHQRYYYPRILGYSTFEKINQKFKNRNQLIKSINIEQYEYDHDLDDRYDQLKIIINVPLDQNSTIQGFRLIPIFQYRLNEKIQLIMETIGDLNMLDKNNLLKEYKMIRIEGHLQFIQRKPFSNDRFKSLFNEYNHSIFEHNHDLEYLLLNYSRRNYFTRLNIDYEQWQSLSMFNDQPIIILNKIDDHHSSFRLDLNIHYYEQLYHYYTNFWYMIKWAFIQYVCIFIFVDYFIFWLKTYVHDQYIVASIPQLNQIDHQLLNEIYMKKQF